MRDQVMMTYLYEPVAAVLDGLALLGGWGKVGLTALILDELEDLLDAEALDLWELLMIDFVAADHLLLAFPDHGKPFTGAIGLRRNEVAHFVDIKVVAFAEGVEDGSNLPHWDGLDHLQGQNRVRTE